MLSVYTVIYYELRRECQECHKAASQREEYQQQKDGFERYYHYDMSNYLYHARRQIKELTLENAELKQNKYSSHKASRDAQQYEQQVSPDVEAYV